MDVASHNCVAGVGAIFEVLGSSPARLPVAIEIASGAACPPGGIDCVYGLLPGHRLLGHAVVDFGGGDPKRYVNIRVSDDGRVFSDPVDVP